MSDVIGIDQIYFGTENWNNNALFDNFIGDFNNQGDVTTGRIKTINDTYSGAFPSIKTFLSKDSLDALTGYNGAGNLVHPGLLGIVLLLGYDSASQRLKLLVRSANGRSDKPNSLSNKNLLNTVGAAADQCKKIYDSGSEVDPPAPPAPLDPIDPLDSYHLIMDFKNEGKDVLKNWPNALHPIFKFKSDDLQALLYNPPFAPGGEIEFHMALAQPPFDFPNIPPDFDKKYITLIGINNAGMKVSTAPCPPFCYDNVAPL